MINSALFMNLLLINCIKNWWNISKKKKQRKTNESEVLLTSESRWLKTFSIDKKTPIRIWIDFFCLFVKSRYCAIWNRREEYSSQRNGNILAGNQRSGPVKVSVVGGGQGGSKIWRRERIEMTDPDLDDVAFLSGVY